MKNRKTAFTLIELSIVLIIIGFIISVIIGGRAIVQSSDITVARAITHSSPVSAIEDIVVWFETTSNDNFEFDSFQNVLRWRDINPQLRNKSDALQILEAKNPEYVSNGINGLPALYFDNSRTLEVEDQARFNIPTFSIFIVAKISDNGTIIGKTDGVNNTTRRKLQLRKHKFISGNDGDEIEFTSIIDDDSAANIIAVVAYANNNNKIWSNGVSNSYATTLYHEDYNQEGLKIGGSFSNGNSEEVTGYIGEIIIFDRALSDFEVDTINEYLSKKWGIPLSS